VICAMPPDDAAVAAVTVISVPTPNSAPSTLPWAALTPDDSAVTVTTRPMPKASPRAVTTACRIRRRSSRRRYVKKNTATSR